MKKISMEKIKYMIFIFIAFVIPWLCVPFLGRFQLSDLKNVGGIAPFGYYIMILPTTGIIMGQIFEKKKIENMKQWSYLLTFISFTALILLWGSGIIGIEITMTVMSILLCVFSILLFLSCCLGDKKDTPTYHGKAFLFAVGIYMIIDLVIMMIQDFSAKSFLQILVNFFWAMPDIFFMSAIMLYGEEYAWRGHVLGKLQNIFGKRIGVIFMGVIWEFWHLPYFLIAMQTGKISEMIGFSLGLFFLLRLINAIGMSIILGWAYAKTENVWCCVCIHGLNNGVAGGTDSMTEVPFFTILLRFVVMFLFLFTKEYRKDKKKAL